MQKNLSNIKGVLIDLSGTLHISDYVIPGAVEAINRLKLSGLPVRFATNSTKESCQLLYQRLKSFGFNINAEEIFTSLVAARDLLIEKDLDKPYLLLDNAATADFNVEKLNVQTEPLNANAIVFGLCKEKFNYSILNKVFRAIIEKKNDCHLIAIHKGRYYQQPDGLSLGVGPFVTAIEYAADVQSTVVGKPEKKFFQLASETFNCSLNEVAMIGDDVRDDVGGAISAGMIGILVRTGKYRPCDEQNAIKPDYIFSNVCEAIDEILKLRK